MVMNAQRRSNIALLSDEKSESFQARKKKVHTTKTLKKCKDIFSLHSLTVKPIYYYFLFYFPG